MNKTIKNLIDYVYIYTENASLKLVYALFNQLV